MSAKVVSEVGQPLSRRVDRMFGRLRAEQRCGLIAYVTCGDGDTVRIVEALLEAGADAIELGIPFSDPLADGPVIQAAAQRALEAGMTVAGALDVARAIRERSDVPLIAFSYLNPLLRYGFEMFARDARSAGIDSLLLTDLPAGAPPALRSGLRRAGVGSVFLAAPTSSDSRLGMIDRQSDGFVYYVSTTGVTGVRTELDPLLLARLEEVRSIVRKPLAVGFGIARHEHFEALRERCDAIVVGSAIVRAIAAGDAESAPQRAATVVRDILGDDAAGAPAVMIPAAAV